MAIIEEFGGKMISLKKKEAIATTQLYAYLSEELGRTDLKIGLRKGGL